MPDNEQEPQVPVDAPVDAITDAKIERWFAKWFHGHGAKITVELYNHFHAAKEDLKAVFSKL